MRGDMMPPFLSKVRRNLSQRLYQHSHNHNLPIYDTYVSVHTDMMKSGMQTRSASLLETELEHI